MPANRRGGRQGARKARASTTSSRAKHRRNAIRSAQDSHQSSAATSVSSRRLQTQSSGKLDQASAIDALKEMGFAVDADGPINLAEVRQAAEGAAASAAQALGVDLLRPDGSIDAQKARAAIEEMLGLSIDVGATKGQAEVAQRVQQAAIETATSFGVDIRDGKGGIDTNKAIEVVNLALDLNVARKRQLGRREAVDALNTSLNAMTSSKADSRRSASDAVEKLLSSSVLVDGKISRRKSVEVLESYFAEK